MSAKFKIKFKLTGLEFEIEGDRQDVGQLSSTIGNQLGGMLAPVTAAASLNAPQDEAIEVETQQVPTKPKKKSTSKRTPRTSAGESTEVIEFRHDVAKWGNPRQTWTGSQKSIWFLLVASAQAENSELTAGTIAASFNRHFKQSGEIRPSNASRDLGNLKSKKTPAWVGENTSQTPSTWYLTDEGTAQAKLLVSEAKGE